MGPSPGAAVDGVKCKLKCRGALYNCRIMAFLNAQLEKLQGLEMPATTPKHEVAAYDRQLERAERCLAKHADHFDVRDFYRVEDARLAVEKICRSLRARIENWGMAGTVCIQDIVPSADVQEDKMLLGKLLNYILKGAECNVDTELLHRWDPFKQRHTENMKLVQIIEESALQVEEVLGTGGHGTVFKAVWQSADVAVKKPFKTRAGDLPIEEYAGFLREAIQHTVLNTHPNIIRLLATTISAWIVMELADCDLHKLCHYKGGLAWRSKARLLRQGAAALRYIHFQKRVHGDIKPRNFLLVGTHPESLQLKLCDFGLSFEVTPSKSKTVRGSSGTEQYIAPETYKDKPISQASDVYSFGVACYEVISQKHPFGGETAHPCAIMNKKLNREEPCQVGLQDCPPQALELIRQCCALDPSERPTMEEVSKQLSLLSDDWSPDSCTPSTSQKGTMAQEKAGNVSSRRLDWGPNSSSKGDSCPLDWKAAEAPAIGELLMPESITCSNDLLKTAEQDGSATAEVMLDKQADLRTKDIPPSPPMGSATKESLLGTSRTTASNRRSKHGWGAAAIDESVAHSVGQKADTADNGRAPRAGPTSSGVQLLEAAREGNLAAVETMLDNGVDVDFKSFWGVTALMAASQNGHALIVRKILNSSAMVDLVDEDGWTALIYAAWNGHGSVVSTLLDFGATVDPVTEWEATALIVAAQNGHAPVVQRLLDSGAAVDLVDEWGRTALMLAPLNGHTHVVQQLLDSGAAVDLVDVDGDTALHNAAYNGHMPVVKLLLEKGANISARNKEGNTPMMYAAGHGHTPVVDKLLDLGVPLDLVDENGDTVLHHAAKWGQMPVVKLLLEKGADTSIRNKEGVPHGYTAATLAERHDHPEIANFIKNWENPN